MAYTKLKDLDLQDENIRVVAEHLYKDIQRVEQQLVFQEETLEYLKSSIGEKQANLIMGTLVNNSKRLLLGLKITFFYYTGLMSYSVIGDMHAEEEIDIFNL